MCLSHCFHLHKFTFLANLSQPGKHLRKPVSGLQNFYQTAMCSAKTQVSALIESANQQKVSSFSCLEPSHVQCARSMFFIPFETFIERQVQDDIAALGREQSISKCKLGI